MSPLYFTSEGLGPAPDGWTRGADLTYPIPPSGPLDASFQVDGETRWWRVHLPGPGGYTPVLLADGLHVLDASGEDVTGRCRIERLSDPEGAG